VSLITTITNIILSYFHNTYRMCTKDEEKRMFALESEQEEPNKRHQSIRKFVWTVSHQFIEL
jgi:hypothetical protein